MSFTSQFLICLLPWQGHRFGRSQLFIAVVKCTEAYVALSGVWLCLYHRVLRCMVILCCVDFVPGVFSEWPKESGGREKWWRMVEKSVVEKCCRRAL